MNWYLVRYVMYFDIRGRVCVAVEYLFSCGSTCVVLVSVYENATMAKGQARLGDRAVSLLPSSSSSYR